MVLISGRIKFIIVAVCFGLSCFGFLIKLPGPLRGMDTELHALFFFLAAAFFNILFGVRKLETHFLIVGMLFLFGALIEFSQEYSNKLVGKRIHGRFDPEDLKCNLIGLAVFSAFWLFYFIIKLVFKKINSFGS